MPVCARQPGVVEAAQSQQKGIMVGRRIVVWGATGSGKTTLSRRLGEMLGLAVVELDAIRHARGWDSVDLEEVRTILTQRLEELSDGWITDGSYSSIMDAYLSRCDTIVWLHLPWRVSFQRLLRRTVPRALLRKRLYSPKGPRESLVLTFLTRRSILWWSISHHRAHVRTVRERLAALPPEVRFYELSSAKEVEAFVRAVEAEKSEATVQAS
jgi:adenylate kinase family enzyme